MKRFPIHTPEGLYYEEPGKEKETLIFESKYQLFIDIAHGIVVVHDGHSEKDDFVEGEPVAVKLWEE